MQAVLLEMNKTVDVESCDCWQLPWPQLPDQVNTDCLWPLLHKHLREWENNHTVRGVIMGSLSADPLKPSLRSATVKSQEMQLLGAEGIIQSVQKRMEDVSLYLYQGLEDVYSKEDRKMLENIRTVLNLERILQLTGDMSPAVVIQREVSKFLEASEYIDPDFDVKYEKSELRTPDKNINFSWVFFETVHGRSAVVLVPLGEVGRIISPLSLVRSKHSCYSNRQLFSPPSYFCPAQLTRFVRPVQL